MTTPSIKEAFVQYRRKQVAELRPYVEGERLGFNISMSAEDIKAGSPKLGDMIARNPKNHSDQWLVAAAYFADNFEPLATLSQPTADRREIVAQKLMAFDGCCVWELTEQKEEAYLKRADRILAALDGGADA